MTSGLEQAAGVRDHVVSALVGSVPPLTRPKHPYHY